MKRKEASKPDIRTKSAARNADPMPKHPFYGAVLATEREREGLVVVYVRVVSRKGKRGGFSVRICELGRVLAGSLVGIKGYCELTYCENLARIVLIVVQ